MPWASVLNWARADSQGQMGLWTLDLPLNVLRCLPPPSPLLLSLGG